PRAVRAQRGRTLEQIGEALKAGRHVMHRLAAAHQFHIKDEPRCAKLYARAFADEDTLRSVALLALRHVLPPLDYRVGFTPLVLPREVHPEQDRAHFFIQTLAQLLRANPFRVTCTASGPEKQERALRQVRSFDRAAWAGSVARAAVALEDVP